MIKCCSLRFQVKITRDDPDACLRVGEVYTVEEIERASYKPYEPYDFASFYRIVDNPLRTHAYIDYIRKDCCELYRKDKIKNILKYL
jgi:hypothetical protein